MKVKLTNGRKTPFGHSMIPMYITALATEESDDIRLRIDSDTNLEAPDREPLTTLTQSFVIPPGHSVLFNGGFDLSDAGYDTYWLAIPKRIAPEQRVTTISRDVAE